jgi:hypothetical protein
MRSPVRSLHSRYSGELDSSHCSMVFTGVLTQVPMTLDTDAWYFGRSLVVLLVLTALATYGFLVSLGSRSALAPTPRSSATGRRHISCPTASPASIAPVVSRLWCWVNPIRRNR